MSTAWKKNVLMVVRSKRPIVQTLQSYTIPKGMRCMLLSDPSVFSLHKKAFRRHPDVEVVRGVDGLAAQAHRIYRLGYSEKYDWVFRLDDDLHDKYFLTPDPVQRVRYPKLAECIALAYTAAIGLHVSLVGFSSTSRLDWMGKYLGLTYGGIHGSAQLHCTAKSGDEFITPDLPRFEDIWRTCSHRRHDGTGRVQMIGIQQAKSSNALVNQSVVDDRPKRRRKAIRMINAAWPDYVSCTRTTFIHGGKVEIPHFAFTRFGFTPRHIEP
jgi:hypothetical protein